MKAPFEILGLEAGGPGFAMWNDCWLDLYDMISEGVLMPLGALIMSILIGWVWNTKTVKEECEESGDSFVGLKMFEVCYKFIVPVVLVIVLYAQIMDFFG